MDDCIRWGVAGDLVAGTVTHAWFTYVGDTYIELRRYEDSRFLYSIHPSSLSGVIGCINGMQNNLSDAQIECVRIAQAL